MSLFHTLNMPPQAEQSEGAGSCWRAADSCWLAAWTIKGCLQQHLTWKHTLGCADTCSFVLLCQDEETKRAIVSSHLQFVWSWHWFLINGPTAVKSESNTFTDCWLFNESYQPEEFITQLFTDTSRKRSLRHVNHDNSDRKSSCVWGPIKAKITDNLQKICETRQLFAYSGNS